jgi:uncharacterized integral membrane protein
MLIKKHIKKIIFFAISISLFVIFAISNSSKITIEIFNIREDFKIWVLVLYSIFLGSFITILFILPSIIMLKSRHKNLVEKFETLSDSKLAEFVKRENEIIE